MFLIKLLLTATLAEATPIGVKTEFASPNGLNEICVVPSELPGGDYSDTDRKRAAALCALNFYDNSLVLCPKFWSTSPGTILNINSTGLASVDAEATHCRSKNNGLKTAAKFKQSMNQNDTSGTYSLSALMYYQLSRFLKAKVGVPVAVYRTMDLKAHYARVTSLAKPTATKVSAGWGHLVTVETNAAAYGSQLRDILTPDRKQIYGTLVKGGGVRYGNEINGTRALNSIALQNFEMQQTPAFLALQSSEPFPTAISVGTQQAFQDPRMAAAFPLSNAAVHEHPSPVQMNAWMRDMSEIAILDFILGQQDRVGNIDFKWKWIYLDENGDLQKVDEDSEVPLLHKAMIPVPAAIKKYHPQLIQESIISDNDAGGYGYSNEAQNSGMLDGKPLAKVVPAHEAIHHLSLDGYRQLQILGHDFAIKGPVYKSFAASVGLTKAPLDQRRLETIRRNAVEAAKIFRDECVSKTLLLDLQSTADSLRGIFSPKLVVDCAQP